VHQHDSCGLNAALHQRQSLQAKRIHVERNDYLTSGIQPLVYLDHGLVERLGALNMHSEEVGSRLRANSQCIGKATRYKQSRRYTSPL
tara:strand:- start:67 stop:330 length:264 start_codon:yes stop_codon:yes gene_type:complete